MISCTHRLLDLEFLKIVLVRTLVVTVQHIHARFVMFFFPKAVKLNCESLSPISTFATWTFKGL